MDTLDQFIKSHLECPAESGPLLSELMMKGAAQGMPMQELKNKIFPLCEDPQIQDKWSNWSSVTDREEVRLRLMAINSFKTVQPSLVPFVLFYFRASDSVLYQTAAQIAGKHLPHHAEIQNYISGYLKERKLDPEKPVEMNGQRNRRRLLILFTACIAANGRETKLAGKKVTIAPPLESLPADLKQLNSRLDYSAIMLAISLLAGTDTDPGEKLISSLLQLPETVMDRNIIRNWGLLLNAYKASPEKKKSFCANALDDTMNLFAKAETYTAQLQVLYRADEIIRSAVFVLQGERSGLIPENYEEELTKFIKIRFYHWCSREVAEADIPEPAASGSGILNRISTISTGNHDQELLFTELLQSVQSEQAWRLQPLSERVWKTFFLIDMAIHSQFVSSDEMKQLLSGLYSDAGFSDYDKMRPLSPLSVLLRRLLHLEQTARGSIMDGRLIHKVADEKLLLALLPSGVNSELLPVFADAFEHQIRLLIETDSSFNPDHYLYKITIREPHHNFYKFLTELMRSRRYGEGDNKDESFRLKLEYLTTDHAQQRSAQKMNGLLKKSGFWSSLEKIRERQEAQLETDNLFMLLNHLQHEIDGTGQEQLTHTATLHDLLNIIHDGEPQWLRSGFPPYWNRPASVLNQRLVQLNRQIKTDIEKLKPETLASVPEAGEAAQRIRGTLNETEHLIAPSLGAVEAALFSALITRTGELLNNWVQVLVSAEAVWQQYDEQRPGEQHNYWNSLFKTAADSDNPHIRREMQLMVLNSVLQQREGSRKKSWFTRYQFLIWAAQNPAAGSDEESEYLLELLRKHWGEMLHEAMDRKQEARVVQLVKTPELKQLRRSEKVTPQLETVKTWCFDRYDLLHAFICNREINPEVNFVTSRWKTLREYFGHFSGVWVALIIGVILMFDFGDPWTELAEIGDVGGVIFTFVLGVGGTYLYVFSDLRKKVNLVQGDPFQWASQFGRVGIFLGMTLAFTVLVVLLFYYMFYNTDQVVHGVNAIWHIISWTGFALFVGVFFGLIGKQ